MFKEWSKYEKWWVGIFFVLIMSTTLIFSYQGTKWDSWSSIFLNWIISPVSAITGILCVALAAKGNIWTYPIGLINCITYGYLSWKVGYYGDWILNWFYFTPTQVYGYYAWKNNLEKKDFVKKRVLTFRQKLIWISFAIIFTIIFSYMLQNVDFWFINAMKRNESIYRNITMIFGISLIGPILDATTEMLQIFGQLLMIKRYAEQWIMWILTNVISIVMWICVLVTDKTSVSYVAPTLVMWIGYLINSIYGWNIWKKSKENVAI